MGNNRWGTLELTHQTKRHTRHRTELSSSRIKTLHTTSLRVSTLLPNPPTRIKALRRGGGTEGFWVMTFHQSKVQLRHDRLKKDIILVTGGGEGRPLSQISVL